MIRWLRVTLPPGWAIALAVIGYLALEVLTLAIEWRLNQPFYSDRDMQMLIGSWAAIVAIAYGVFRVWAFHPVYRPGYRDWLASTPWTHDKPLPLGPIHLVWQDVLLVAIVVGILWPRLEFEALRVVRFFLFTYLACLASTHLATRERWAAYSLCFALGFMMMLAQHPTYVLAAAISYGIGYLALRPSLARFPWPESVGAQRWEQIMRNQGLGWPFERTGPPREHYVDETPRADRVIGGLLLGWWVFIVGSPLGWTGVGGMFIVYYYFLAAGIVFRLANYCNGYFPPLTLLGRLRYGRLIIPGYDQVFVAPLLALAIGIVLPFVPGWTGVEPYFIQPIGFTLTSWIIFVLGPDLKTWRLTGEHRIAMGLMMTMKQK